MHHADFLIIGSGIAGLTAGLKVAEAAPDQKVIILTKAEADESNTKYAQGGIAVVTEATDSFEKHVADTLRAGDGLCDEDVVRMVISEGPQRLEEIIKWGARFDEDESGNLDLGKEGGHTENRVVHYKDITGFEVERALLSRINAQENITLLPHYFAIDIITEHHILKVQPTLKSKIKCFGAYALNTQTGKIETFVSGKTLLASGGAGQVYAHTTNPKIATGDGIAVAYRAKAFVTDMQFVQFHPTAMYEPNKSPSFLISEAVRGFGAYLRDKEGNRFMLDYDERAELASRDIVSQSIDKELKKSGVDCVYLDCTHLDMEKFRNHFPNIYDYCLNNGIDVAKEWIPVVPAAHYMCGGIKVDQVGRTTIKNLYACGECSRTGLHGANRLASNSLLEALVYAHHIATDVIENPETVDIEIPLWYEKGTTEPQELVLITHNIKEVQSIMSDYVAIVRSTNRLNRALNRLKVLYEETEELYHSTKLSPQLCELRNLISIAYIIAKQSLDQKENKGTFFSLDN